MDEWSPRTMPETCPQCGLPTRSTVPLCPRCGFDLCHAIPGKPRRGKCIYCEEPANLSDEHVYGDWIRMRFPSPYTETVHEISRPSELGFVQDASIHSRVFPTMPKDPLNATVRNVCGGCNNGWMSNLQNDAKHAVISLIDGSWSEFTDRDRSNLARWIAMVTINLECRGNIISTPQFQRTQLLSGEMPEGWRIYIGRMRDEGCSGQSWNRALATQINVPSKENLGTEQLKMQSTYFVIGPAVMYSLSCTRGKYALELGLLSLGIEDDRVQMRQIWPVHQDASADTFLSQQELDNLQRRFGR